MVFRKGQGATEYLVLLAVVLIIALISIALLGFFPGLATDAKKTQSDTYWRGQASPFRVLDHTIATSNGVMTLSVQNSGSDKITLNAYAIGGTAVTGLNTSFQGGETKNINLTLGTNPCTGATRYEILGTQIMFNYTTINSLAKVQGGDAPTKSLVGTCS